MTLPDDSEIARISLALVDEFAVLYGKHPGFRSDHARGILLSGSFTPTQEAATLSCAPHFVHGRITDVTFRFSSATGMPLIPDTDPGANPRGFAMRFHIGHRREECVEGEQQHQLHHHLRHHAPNGTHHHLHHDMAGHSLQAFPGRTGQDALELLRAIAASPPGTASPTALETFIAAHPAAQAFFQAPKPFPSSFAREMHWPLNAFRFTNADDVERYGRWVLVPEQGVDHHNKPVNSDPNYLYDEIRQRIGVEKRPVKFKLLVQLANEGDVVDDISIQWPQEGHETIEVGMVCLDSLVDNGDKEQKRIIFNPLPRGVPGIQPSDDPILVFRAATYLISGHRRRAAPDMPAT